MQLSNNAPSPENYAAINEHVAARVPRSATRILDVGCGTGALGLVLRRQGAREIVGITHSAGEAELATPRLDRVIVADLNVFSFGDIGHFDCIICSHVLEHLIEPVRLLVALWPHLVQGGNLIVALPNVLHWRQRLDFLRGHFRYTAGELMDSTHLRFFDVRTARSLISDAGYHVVQFEAVGSFPLPFVRRLIPRAGARIDRGVCTLWPGLFGWQFVIVAQPGSDGASS